MVEEEKKQQQEAIDTEKKLNGMIDMFKILVPLFIGSKVHAVTTESLIAQVIPQIESLFGAPMAKKLGDLVSNKRP